MRTPLNIVVIGLELLTNVLRKNKVTKSMTINSSSNSSNKQLILNRQDDGDEDDIEDIVNNISISCKSTVEILNDMLAYEKMESGLFSIECRYCPVISMVKDIVLPFQLQARQKNISLKLLDKIQNEQLCIYADSIKMGQVIRNLLSNALKFTPNDGTVTVVIEVVTPDGQPLGVKDTINQHPDEMTSINTQDMHAMKPIIRHVYDVVTNPTEYFTWMGRFKRHASILPRYMSEDELTAAQSTQVQRNSSNPEPSNNYVPFRVGEKKPRKRAAFGAWVNSGVLDSKLTAGQSLIRISVIDTGVGILESNIKKLFNEVVQFDSNTLQVSYYMLQYICM